MGSASKVPLLAPELVAKVTQVAKLPQSENKTALQIVPVQLRAWVVDQNDVVCRPYYVACLELYPRGKVINQRIHSPASEAPNSEALIAFMLDHFLEPPAGELRQRPTHVSFVDESIPATYSTLFARIHIQAGHLTLADGVAEYVKVFSDKLVQMERASRGDAAERPGLLSVPGVTAPAISSLMAKAIAMHCAAPWKRIPEHVALEATVPPPPGSSMRRLKFFLSVLGSEEKATGFAVMASLKMLRAKFKRATIGLDLDAAEEMASGSSSESGSKVGELLCAACGQRVGEDRTRDGGRYVDRCGGCQRLLYCNEECQRRDWGLRHREECASAKSDPDYIFRRSEWGWLQRELALLFVDPTSLPFDDLDAAAEHKWPLVETSTPPLYAMPFVTIDNVVAVARHVERPNTDEVRIITLLAEALTECSAPPPGGGALHLANGVVVRVAENLEDSFRAASKSSS